MVPTVKRRWVGSWRSVDLPSRNFTGSAFQLVTFEKAIGKLALAASVIAGSVNVEASIML